jgi:Spy/CpxP family protein refolding chaperone
MMKMFFAVAVSVMAVSAACSSAAVAQSAQPYSGMENRPIKALSSRQVSDLKAGRGMGLALAAELNGYPGPSHLVELSDRLGLTPGQLSKLKGMFDAMKAETIPIGERLVAQEAHLDGLFAENLISEQTLEAATQDIGETQARLRNAHLRYHLQARAILQPSQIRRYAELRGYGAGLQVPAHHHHDSQ